MKRLARAAIVTTMRDAVSERGSWSGETHLQKALYILQEGAGVPLGYNFILYKHGPFSFDLRSEITEFRGDGLLELQPQGYPYGPRLNTTDAGHRLQTKFPKTLTRYSDVISEVADLVGSKGVAELERIGTALLMLKSEQGLTDEAAAQKIVDVKPHVSETDALEAVRMMRDFLRGLEEGAPA